ncbi:hypothetical protein QL285_040190 [Trifolium repens]|jgi:hypothetical protein|nr:hypothetical protein QL285_040190 [Trifolium repens]
MKGIVPKIQQYTSHYRSPSSTHISKEHVLLVKRYEANDYKAIRIKQVQLRDKGLLESSNQKRKLLSEETLCLEKVKRYQAKISFKCVLQ